MSSLHFIGPRRLWSLMAAFLGLAVAPVALVHAALIFEHTGLEPALDNALALVADVALHPACPSDALETLSFIEDTKMLVTISMTHRHELSHATRRARCMSLSASRRIGTTRSGLT
mgnify:CR=1 FL=1